jgi:hypothetical protein
MQLATHPINIKNASIPPCTFMACKGTPLMFYVCTFPGFSCKPPVVVIMHWPLLLNIVVSGLAARIVDLYAFPLSSKLQEFHPIGAPI